MSDHWYETPKAMGKARIESAQGLAILAAISLVLALWLPMLGGQYNGGFGASTLADGSGRLVAYVLISAGVVLAGALAVPRGGRGAALGGGAALPVAGLLGFMASLVFEFSEFGDVSVGPGFVFACVSFALCLTLFVMTLRRRDRATVKRSGAAVAIGMISAAGLTLGTMLSPGKAGTSFSKLNFGWSSWHMQVAWLMFVASVGLPGLIGFALKSVWGADLALGALLAPAWLVLTGLAPATAPSIFAFTFRAVHPVIVIAIAGQIAAQVLFRLAKKTGARATTPS